MHFAFDLYNVVSTVIAKIQVAAEYCQRVQGIRSSQGTVLDDFPHLGLDAIALPCSKLAKFQIQLGIGRAASSRRSSQVSPLRSDLGSALNSRCQVRICRAVLASRYSPWSCPLYLRPFCGQEHQWTAVVAEETNGVNPKPVLRS